MTPQTSQSSAQDALTRLPHGAAADLSVQFITFTLDDAEYGVNIMAVQEIKGWTETSSIPNVPPFVRGVINLRGVIVPIFDLRARFGMGSTDATKMHVVIIVNTEGKTVGLLVDAVSDILTVNPNAIRPVPEMGLPADDRFLDGLVALDDRMVTLVSLDALIGSLRGGGQELHCGSSS